MVTKLAKRHEFIGAGPVRYRLEGPPEAPVGASIAIDYTDAPIPEHYYVADYARVTNVDPQVLLTFGKWNRLEEPRALRSKVEVFFPSMLFVKQFWSSSREFHKILRGFAERNRYPIPAMPASEEVAERVQTFHSNNVLMVFSGDETMMDFFYLSPRDMYLRAPKHQNIELEALVRIVLTPTLLLSLLDACDPIARELGVRFPDIEGEHETLEHD